MPTPNKPDDKHDVRTLPAEEPKLASKAGPSGVEPADESDFERAAPKTPEAQAEARKDAAAADEKPSMLDRASEALFPKADASKAEQDEKARRDDDDDDDAGDKPKRSSRRKKEPTRLPYHRITEDGPLHVAFRDTRTGLDSRKNADRDAQFRCHGCGSMIRYDNLEAEPEPEKETAKK